MQIIKPIPETDCYYYHLGSSSFITDANGIATQCLHYLPYGETFINQQTNSFQSRYTFSGKEKDIETNYGYFGARYYNSNISIWLSVDPLADKYPSLSPYNYCALNPIMLVDPDGREIDPTSEKYVKAYENETQKRIVFLKDKMKNIDQNSKHFNNYSKQIDAYSNVLSEIADLRDDPNNIYSVSFGKSLGQDVHGKVSYGGERDNKRLINIELAAKESTNFMFTLGTFAHEMKHAHQFFRGDLGFATAPDGTQTSNNSQALEIEAGIRGSLFSGNTMTNNNTFNFRNPNLDSYNLSDKYKKDYRLIMNPNEARKFWTDNGYKNIIFNK